MDCSVYCKQVKIYDLAEPNVMMMCMKRFSILSTNELTAVEVSCIHSIKLYGQHFKP